jgi:hypothetical protein
MIKRLLNVRYIKIWNLFLANGINKKLQINLNFEKSEKNEDISDAVDKLLIQLNEGEIATNEISEYMNNYFEKKRHEFQNKKQTKFLSNQYYQSEILKKIMLCNYQKNCIKDKTIDNDKYNKKNFSNINKSNLSKKNNSIITYNNKSGRNGDTLEEKYNLMVRNILNISKENLNKQEYNYMNIINSRNMKRMSRGKIPISTIFKSKNFFVSKKGKNVNLKTYLSQLNRDTLSLFNENLSGIKHNHYKKKCISNGLKKRVIFQDNDDILQKVDLFGKSKNKKSLLTLKKAINSKTLIRKHINSANVSKEKYRKDRAKYIIKTTRMLFTKNKNLDKIVRKKKGA